MFEKLPLRGQAHLEEVAQPKVPEGAHALETLLQASGKVSFARAQDRRISSHVARPQQRGAACGKAARAVLWGTGEGNFPRLPDPGVKVDFLVCWIHDESDIKPYVENILELRSVYNTLSEDERQRRSPTVRPTRSASTWRAVPWPKRAPLPA